MNRIIIFTGKGGVGKSSVAAAHAVKSAGEGKKTLLVSTDMAHNIADIFRMPVGSQVTQIKDCLYGLELDPDQLMKEEFADTNKSIRSMISESGFSVVNMSDDITFPGFEDLFGLLKIGKIYESGEFERIIVDCAPTGETLSLLQLPELLSWYLEKFFPVGNAIIRVLSPISKVAYNVELPSREKMNSIQRMYYDLLGLQKILKNEEVCSVRLVCIPEKMVVEETKRNLMYLNLYDYQVDGLYINRVLPETMDNPFFANWKKIQQGYMHELDMVFAGYPVTRIPWYPKELRGMDTIERVVADVFDAEAQDMFAVRVHKEKETYEKTADGYALIIQIPVAKDAKIRVDCHGLDVDIAINNFERRIPLPNSLRGAKIKDTVVTEGSLRINFLCQEVADPCES